MRLRVEAKDGESAARAVAEQLAARGLSVATEALDVQPLGEQRRGVFGRLLRRDHTFQVTVDPAALKGYPLEKVYAAAQDLGADLAGTVQVRFAPDGVFLRAFASTGSAKRRMSVAEVMRVLEQRQVVDVDMAAVERLVEQVAELPTPGADTGWVKVAERRPELDRDAEVLVELSDDRMEAAIVVKPPLGGREATLDDLRNALAAHGVRFGIDEEALAAFVREPVYEQRIVVARGRPAKRGRDGYVEMLVASGESRPKEREDGTVDFRELVADAVVKEGDAIARWHAPEPGEDGMDVTGEVVAGEPGQPPSTAFGAGVRLDEESGIVYAERTGRVIATETTLAVDEVFEVQGDVDYSVGNLRFPGTIIVHGDIWDDFVVEADGSVIVHGTILGATVTAKSGDIQVKKGIRGRENKGTVSAPNGKVTAKFIEGAKVQARIVEVQDAILYSDITAAESIRVMHGQGRISGGKLEAGISIEAAVVGSEHGTRTELVIVEQGSRAEQGPRPAAEGQEPLAAWEEAIRGSASPAEGGGGDHWRSAVMTATARRPRRKRGDKEPMIRVSRVCYPNTLIRIGSLAYLVNTEMMAVRFRKGDGEIDTGWS